MSRICQKRQLENPLIGFPAVPRGQAHSSPHLGSTSLMNPPLPSQPLHRPHQILKVFLQSKDQHWRWMGLLFCVVLRWLTNQNQCPTRRQQPSLMLPWQSGRHWWTLEDSLRRTVEWRGEGTFHSEAHRRWLLLSRERKNCYVMCLCIFSPQDLDSWWVWGSGNLCYTGMDKRERFV